MAKVSPKDQSLPRLMLISLRAVPPLKRTVVIVGVFIASIFELVGFAAIIPLFTILSPDSGMKMSGRREMIHHSLQSAFGAVGLPMNMLTLLLAIVALMMIKAAVSIAVAHYVAGIMTEVNTKARLRVIQTLMNARWSFYATQRLGQLVSAAGESANAVGEAFQISTDVLAAILRVAIYLLICYLIAPAMVLVGVAVAGFMVVSYGALVRRSKRAIKDQGRAMGQMKSNLADIFVGIKSIRAMGRQAQMATLLAKDVDSLEGKMKSRVLSAEYADELQAPIIAVCLILGLLGGSTLLHLSGHELLLAALLLVRLINTFGAVQRGAQRLTTRQGLLAVSTRLVTTAAARPEQLTGTESPDPAAGIRFQRLSFKYPNGPQVLSKTDFVVEPAKITVLTGASGAGKSTIVDFIVGLLQRHKGKLFLGGVNSKAVDLLKWRQSIGYVPQEITLFHDTVRNNVALGEQRFSDEDIWRALRAAGADEFVELLRDGLDHVVGERGQKISGGQRQRIALARALLHRPAILILDEATTGLDRESEEGICARIRDIVHEEGLTVLAISHGDTWRQLADHVYKLADGTIVPVEPGTPAEIVPISTAKPPLSA
jgi:ATP-binding cassette subfamily C protein